MVNLQKGLVGHWTMDDADTSGGTLYDRSAYDRNASFNGTINTSKSSYLGEGYDFSNNGYLTAPSTIDPSQGSMSIVATPTTDSDAQYALAQTGSPTNGKGGIQEFGVDLGAPAIFEYFSGDTRPTISAGGSLNVEQQYLFTWENGNKLQAYRDGELINETGIGNLDMSGIENGTDLVISATTDESTTSRYFDGKLSDIRVYNRVLSKSEVRALYNMRSQRTIKSSPRVYYYDTQSLYNSNGHANNKSELGTFFDPTRSDVSVLYNGIHKRDTIYHGLEGQSSTFGTVNAEPEYFTNNDGYSWEIEGTFVAPESGTYSFGIDGDDAMDLIIDGTVVAEWYGGHGFNGDVANHSGTISLDKNTGYDFTYRYEEGGGGSGGAVGWKKPSDNSWKIFPANLLV